MKKILLTLCVIALCLGFFGIANAASLRYEVTGGAYPSGSDADNYWGDGDEYPNGYGPIFGVIYVSEVHSGPVIAESELIEAIDTYDSGTGIVEGNFVHTEFYVEVNSFAINVGDEYGFGGASGVILWDNTDTWLILAGVGDWNYWRNNTEIRLLSADGPNPYMSWGWGGGQMSPELNGDDGRFVLRMEYAPIPEAATVLLLGTGLVGLAGFRKKFKK